MGLLVLVNAGREFAMRDGSPLTLTAVGTSTLQSHISDAGTLCVRVVRQHME